MESYGNDFFSSQEAYPSIDFTLLDRPSGSITSAPETTASLLPDPSFPSLDFLDGAGIESFRKVSFPNDESLEINGDSDPGFRTEKYGQPDSTNIGGQGGGDADFNYPSSQFQLPSDMQKPISDVDFFCTKGSGGPELQLSHGVPCGVHDFFQRENLPQPSGPGSWSLLVSSWADSGSPNEQSEMAYHGTFDPDVLNAQNYSSLQADASGNAGIDQPGSSSQMLNNTLTPISSHSFLPTDVDPSSINCDPSQMVLGLGGLQQATSNSAIKSQPRGHSFNYEGLANGSLVNQLKPSSSLIPMDASPPQRQISNANDLAGHESMDRLPNQNGRFVAQTIEGFAPVEAPFGYDFLSGQLCLKGQHGHVADGQQPGGVGRELGLSDMQLWQQQQFFYMQQLHELHRQRQAQQLMQHSQPFMQQQMQQLLSNQSQVAGNPYSSLLFGNSSYSVPPSLQTNSGLIPIGLENQSAAFMGGSFANASAGVPGSSGGSSSQSLQGLTHDFPTGGQGQNLFWQTLLLKGLQQPDPMSYGSVGHGSRDVAAQMLAFYPGPQNALAEQVGGGSIRLPNAQVGKPVPRSFTAGSPFVGDAQMDYLGLTASQGNSGQDNPPYNRHQQDLGRPLSGQDLQQSIWQVAEQSQVDGRFHHQVSSAHRNQQQFDDFHGQHQRIWHDPGQKEGAHKQNISQGLEAADTTYRNSMVNNHNVGQSDWQSINPCQPVSGSDVRFLRKRLQQSSGQAGNTQFSASVGLDRRSEWVANQVGALAKHSAGGDKQQEPAWSSFQLLRSQIEARTGLQLMPNLKQSTWSGHQNSSLGRSSSHPFNESDSQQLEAHSVPHSQSPEVGSSMPVTFGVSGSQVNQRYAHSVDGRERQASGWKEQNMQEGGSQTSGVVRSFMNLHDGTQSSWRESVAHHSAVEAVVSSKLPNVDAGWGQNLQHGNLPEGLHKTGNCSSNKLHNLGSQYAELSQRTRNMLLMNVDTGQQKNDQDEQLRSINQKALNYSLIDEHARQINAKDDFNLRQENLHKDPVSFTLKSDMRQNSHQHCQPNDMRMEAAGHPITLRSEKNSLRQDEAQVWDSLTSRVSTRQFDTFKGNDSCRDTRDLKPIHVGQSDLRLQSTTRDHGSCPSSPWREEGSKKQPLTNSGLHMQSRLSEMSVDATETLPYESSTSVKLPLPATASVSQRQFQTNTLVSSEERSEPEAHRTKAPGGTNFGRPKPPGQKLRPGGFVGIGKDFPFSKSQANFSPRAETGFLKSVSASASLPATALTPDRGAFPTSVNKSLPLLRDTLELLNRPGPSAGKISTQASAVEEQCTLHNQAKVALSSLSLAQFKHNQSSSPLSPQNIGLGLAPPSHLCQSIQQDCSPDLDDHMHGQKVDGRVVGLTTLSRAATSQDGSDCNVNGPRAIRPEFNRDGSKLLGIHDMRTQGPSLATLGTDSGCTPCTLDSGQLSATQGNDVQTVAATRLVTLHQSGKPLVPSHTEFDIDESSSVYVSHSESTKQNVPVVQSVKATFHEQQETQGGQFSRLFNNFKNSLPRQHRLYSGHEKPFSGVFESFRPPATTQSGSGFQPQPDSQPILGSLSKTGKSFIAGQSHHFETHTTRQSVVDEGSKLVMMQQQNSPCKSGASGPNSSPQTQVEEPSRASPGQLAGSLIETPQVSPLRTARPIEGQETLKTSFVPDHSSPLRPSASVPQRTQLQEAKNLLLERFSNCQITQGQCTQQMDTSSDSQPVSQTSESLSHSDTQGVMSAEPITVRATMKQGGGIRKPPKYSARSGVVGTNKIHGRSNQQPAHFHPSITHCKASTAVKNVQPQVAATSESPSKVQQGHLQRSEKVPHMHSQLQNQVLSSILAAVSQIPVAKSIPQSQLHTETGLSLPHTGKDDDENILAEQVAQGMVPQQFVGKTLDKSSVVLQSPHFSGGLAETYLKDGESRLPSTSSRSTAVSFGQIGQQHFSALESGFHIPVTLLPRKRKKLYPPSIPWHVAIMKPVDQLLSASNAGSTWAAATNRFPEKDDESDTHDEGMIHITRAKRRLKLTTQLMQQLVPPLPPALLQSNIPIDYECTAYVHAKLALEDACQLIVRNRKETWPSAQNGGENKNLSLEAPGGDHVEGQNSRVSVLMRLLEGFIENAKQIDHELTRLEGSTSTLEIRSKIQIVERLSIVNRLAKHHGKSIPLEFFESSSVEKANSFDSGSGIRRPFPQKYVTAVPMPRNLPEGAICLPL